MFSADASATCSLFSIKTGGGKLGDDPIDRNFALLAIGQITDGGLALLEFTLPDDHRHARACSPRVPQLRFQRAIAEDKVCADPFASQGGCDPRRRSARRSDQFAELLDALSRFGRNMLIRAGGLALTLLAVSSGTFSNS